MWTDFSKISMIGKALHAREYRAGATQHHALRLRYEWFSQCSEPRFLQNRIQRKWKVPS